MTALSAVLGACDHPGAPDPATGTLELSVTGLPANVSAEITISGPNGFTARVSGPQTFANLEPGSYTVAATQVVTGVATFVPAFQSLPVTVGASATSQVAVVYTITTGSISVIVAGAPADVPWKVVVTGPAGYRDSVSANTTLGNLAPGTYTVSAGEIQKGPNIYGPKPAQFTLNVTASLNAAPAVIGYSLVTGSLALHVNGLPAGVDANVTLAGPGGYAGSATASTSLEGLREGRYSIAATVTTAGSGPYTPSPATQSVTIVPGVTSLVSINYWPGSAPPGLNLAIDALHVQQVVQTYGGAVPSVAGRDALLRVFVRASEANAASPVVRVRLYDGAQLIATEMIPASGVGVPTVIDEGQLTASWNYSIPATLMKPGLRVLAEVDPGNAVPETIESDNSYPSSGTPLALDVRVTAPLAVRLVPITQSATGLTGNVTTANLPQYVAAARVLPVGTLTMDIRAPYTTQAPAVQGSDANGAWVQILSELNALRAAEGTTAHYYGVVKAPYSAGVAGLSYLPSVVAVGWDTLPHAAVTMAHELGHNFGRLHVSGCGAGGIDANYPYPNGTIGVYGYDAATATLRDPSSPDIMNYCDGRWISDYTYTGILSFRASQTGAAAHAMANSPRPGLLVWGRIGPSGPVLEPAFEVNAPAKLPASTGPHSLELFDVSGQPLTTFAFRGDRTVDVPSGEFEQFAFVIPLETLAGRHPARVRVSTGGRRTELAAAVRGTPVQLPDDFAPIVERRSATQVRLTWRDSPGRGIMVRDAETGVILSFARGGRADVTTRARRLDLTLSDGVRSGRRSMEVR